jgi:hypothetical protein
MDVCQTVPPPEVTFADGVRVACHLYPPEVEGAAVRPVEVAAPLPLDVPLDPDSQVARAIEAAATLAEAEPTAATEADAEAQR